VVSLALGIGVGLFAAVVPLSTAARLNLLDRLKSGARDGGPRHSGTRLALVGVQAALSVMLLVGTGLLARSLYNVRGIDLGLDVDRVITVTRPESSTGPRLEEIAVRAREIPGVTNAVLSATQPLDDQFGARAYFDRNGDTLRVKDLSIGFVAAESGYLEAVGTGMMSGRDLSASDRAGAAPVMVVSEELARRVWPGRNPLGECLRIERATAPCYTVVGVARNAHSFSVIEEPKAVFYVTFDQRPDRADVARALVIRTTAGTRSIAERLRAMVGDTIASARRRQVVIMKDMLAPEYRPWELGARLFAAFAALALLLALFGLYGVLSYVVALRRREIGIRMALGADRARVLALVVREGVRQVSIGALAGMVIALGLSAKLEPLLFQVSPRDPTVGGGAAALLITAAALAALIPGRRAMAIDPVEVIRED
jgi:predicted permease